MKHATMKISGLIAALFLAGCARYLESEEYLDPSDYIANQNAGEYEDLDKELNKVGKIRMTSSSTASPTVDQAYRLLTQSASSSRSATKTYGGSYYGPNGAWQRSQWVSESGVIVNGYASTNYLTTVGRIGGSIYNPNTGNSGTVRFLAVPGYGICGATAYSVNGSSGGNVCCAGQGQYGCLN